MTLYRVRAHMRFTEASGLATQARDEMANHSPTTIRKGEPPEEPPANEVRADGDRREYVGDLALTDQAAAEDAYATLSGKLVDSEPIPDDAGSVPSWVQRHDCFHGQDPHGPCVVVESAEGA